MIQRTKKNKNRHETRTLHGVAHDVFWRGTSRRACPTVPVQALCSGHILHGFRLRVRRIFSQLPSPLLWKNSVFSWYISWIHSRLLQSILFPPCGPLSRDEHQRDGAGEKFVHDILNIESITPLQKYCLTSSPSPRKQLNSFFQSVNGLLVSSKTTVSSTAFVQTTLTSADKSFSAESNNGILDWHFRARVELSQARGSGKGEGQMPKGSLV